MSSELSDVKQPKSQLGKLALAIVAGCLLTWCLSVLVNNFQYGKNVVKLDKKLDDYKEEDCIPSKEGVNVNMMQLLKWTIIPAVLNSLIWGGIIWFLTNPSTPAVESTD